MGTLTLQKANNFYDLEGEKDFEGDPYSLICTKWVSRRLGSRPKRIRLHFRLKNPRQAGWMKIKFLGRNEVLTPKNSKYYKSSISHSLVIYLDKEFGYGWVFEPIWIKLEPLEE